MNNSNQKIGCIYENIQLIGQGTFAEVKKGRNKKTGEVQALKVISIPPLNKQVAFSQINQLKILQHDHIIDYRGYIYDQQDQQVFIVMELCKSNLRQLIKINEKNNSFTPQKILNFLVQITSAFLFLESYKVMHLDLKPENILYQQNQYFFFKICDFGCSRISQMSKIPGNDELFGTFNYLAPEIYMQRLSQFRRTSCDIWSLGIILYQMIYKKYPFPVETSGREAGCLCRKFIKSYLDNNYQIKYENKQYEQINNLIKKMLNRQPLNRINWLNLKNKLIQKFQRKQYEFLSLFDCLTRFLKMISLFFQVLWIIRSNIGINIHVIWNQFQTTNLFHRLDHALIHLIYILFNSFEATFSKKLISMTNKQKINQFNQLKSVAFLEQQKICETEDIKISDINDQTLYQVSIINNSKQILKYFTEQAQIQSISIHGMKIFCQNVLSFSNYTNDIFPAGVNSFEQSYKYFQIN